MEITLGRDEMKIKINYRKSEIKHVELLEAYIDLLQWDLGEDIEITTISDAFFNHMKADAEKYAKLLETVNKRRSSKGEA